MLLAKKFTQHSHVERVLKEQEEFLPNFAVLVVEGRNVPFEEHLGLVNVFLEQLGGHLHSLLPDNLFGVAEPIDDRSSDNTCVRPEALATQLFDEGTDDVQTVLRHLE